MRNIILIIASGLLILLTIFTLVDRLLIPTRENNKFIKELEEAQKTYIEEYEAAIKEKEQKEEKVKHEVIVAKNPETDEERIGYVAGEYFSRLSVKNYAGAYDMLYDGFKQLNFPTLEDYEQYCKEKYSMLKNIEYLQAERKNTVLISKVRINFFGDKEPIEHFINITEIKENVYKISFELGE